MGENGGGGEEVKGRVGEKERNGWGDGGEEG